MKKKSSIIKKNDVTSFIISVLAGMTWDLIKHLLKKEDDDNPVKQTYLALSSAMEKFYRINRLEYLEQTVMPELLNNIQEYPNIKWYLRDIIEDTIDLCLTDDQFSNWIDLYLEECRNYPFAEKDLFEGVFVNKERFLKRIENSLSDYCEETCNHFGDFSATIEKVNQRFEQSWKTQLLTIAEELNYRTKYQPFVKSILEFALGDENCDAIINTLCELLSYTEKNYKLPDYNYYRQQKFEYLLKNPHFNKVWLICGTSGSGKTHLLHEYSKNALFQLNNTIHDNSIVSIPCIIHPINDDLHNQIIKSLQHLFGEELSFNEIKEVINTLGIRISIILENISILMTSPDDFIPIKEEIEELSKYDQFRFIMTINEYDYYLIAPYTQFLERYCIVEESSISHNCFSIDEENKVQKIIEQILDSYGIIFPYDDFKAGINTPQEALFYGESAQDEKEALPPSTYYSFVENIVRWKDAPLRRRVTSKALRTVIEGLINNHSLTIQDGIAEDTVIKALKDAQLISYQSTQRGSIYSLESEKNIYQIRIYPYWAAKIISTLGINIIPSSLFQYPSEIIEWLISNYIFYNDRDLSWDTVSDSDLNVFFNYLWDNHLLEYALFCAQKSDKVFAKALYSFIIGDCRTITNSKLCYAIIRFIYQSSLKRIEKYRLCCRIADYVIEDGLKDVYERTMTLITENSSNASKLRKDMIVLSPCKNNSINYINGYIVGHKYMQLSFAPKYETIVDIIKQLISVINNNDELLNQIKKSEGNNESYMDFFLRSCFEYIIFKTGNILEIYEALQNLFFVKFPIGAYIKRNLTCAAGNIFQKGILSDTDYKSQYISLAKMYSRKHSFYEKSTAWFLISNSVGNDGDPLDRELFKILIRLAKDKTIMDKYGENIQKFLASPYNLHN